MSLSNTELRNYDSNVLRLPADKRTEYHEQVDRLIAELSKTVRSKTKINITKVVKAGSFAKYTILRKTSDDPVDVDVVFYISGKSATSETIETLSPPTAGTCARSLDERKTSNEWFIKNYKVIGLFVFCPIRVRQAFGVPPEITYVEAPIGFAAVIEAFSDLRIFSIKNGKFAEINRETRTWSPIQYDAILAA